MVPLSSLLYSGVPNPSDSTNNLACTSCNGPRSTWPIVIDIRRHGRPKCSLVLFRSNDLIIAPDVTWINRATLKLTNWTTIKLITWIYLNSLSLPSNLFDTLVGLIHPINTFAFLTCLPSLDHTAMGPRGPPCLYTGLPDRTRSLYLSPVQTTVAYWLTFLFWSPCTRVGDERTVQN